MGVFRSSRAFELKSCAASTLPLIPIYVENFLSVILVKLMPNTSSATMFVTEDHTSYPEWKTSGTAVRVPSWQHHPSRR
ncbi:hypothetical protein PGT21_023614 [Puccinia graminis f. sp. tritici]|uniref:Uncharacterized protein n=1 Tax=Puccinia graminis f. sp. tritici TaxID=56615 RepID=A0A5B0MA67_PUCGR|nr:hypothetical protein PGT21_023614 [Puccinia graminis f. sp. tritici]KAA1132778.1 hypothetical protein PGTUg99_011990 [Puccinia graminis f. sp. tritici]